MFFFFCSIEIPFIEKEKLFKHRILSYFYACCLKSEIIWMKIGQVIRLQKIIFLKHPIVDLKWYEIICNLPYIYI